MIAKYDDPTEFKVRGVRTKFHERAIAAFTDKASLERWLSSDSRYGTMPARDVLRAALDAEVDAVVINPGRYQIEIGSNAVRQLAEGLNPEGLS